MAVETHSTDRAMITAALLILAQVLITVHGKTLGNSLVGTPTVSCGPESLTISAVSSDVFEGQIFIKSHRSVSPDCFSLFSSDMNSTSPTYSLPLSRISSCGLEMVRDSEAKSLRLSAAVVYAFHPQFVTSGDRAYAVHCLFQQKDVRVETQFDSIHDIHSIPLSGLSIEVPKVEMKIVSGSDETSGAAEQMQVGAPMMLVWRLSQPSQMYGIRIVDCIASDAEGDGQPILTGGCATDDHLISHVRYSAAEDRAFSEVTAFKLPDEEQLFIRCRISFCIRKTARLLAANAVAESSFCQPSKCDEPRLRRQTESLGEPMVIVGRAVNVSEALPLVSAEEISSVCVSEGVFAATASLSATIYVAAAVTALLVYRNFRRKRSFTF